MNRGNMIYSAVTCSSHFCCKTIIITASVASARIGPDSDHRPAKRAGVWNYGWILGGRYLALFDQRKSVQLSQANFTRSFSLLRRGCSLVHFLTAGGARYITVTSPSVNLDCSVSCMVRKQLGVACALLLALRHAALLGLGFLDYLFIYLFIRGLNMTISNIVDIVQCARSNTKEPPLTGGQ